MNMEGATETANDINSLAVQANVGKEEDIINVIEKANEYSGESIFFVLMLVLEEYMVSLKLKLAIGKISGK